MSKPEEKRATDLVLLDKRGLAKMLLDYEHNVKSADEVKPAIDRIFENLRRLSLGAK